MCTAAYSAAQTDAAISAVEHLKCGAIIPFLDILPALKGRDSHNWRHMSVPGKDI